MHKFIILTISVCFGLSEAIYNNTTKAIPQAVFGSLSDVVINTKTTINQEEAIDTHRCNNLHIQETGELHIANPKQIKNSKAIFEVNKDIIINGKITCDDNVHVQLISENIYFDKAIINAKNFTCLAEKISVQSTNISSSNLNLGSFKITKTLHFDALSTISTIGLSSTINLLAKNTACFGRITAPVGTIEVSGSESINIDGIKVDTRYKDKCGTFIIDPADVVIGAQGGADTTLLYSQIQQNLIAGDVCIKADNSITVNAPIDYQGANLLTFDAPAIFINAPINVGHFKLTNTTKVGTDTPKSQVDIDAAVALAVSDLSLENCNIDISKITVTNTLSLSQGDYQFSTPIENPALCIYIQKGATLLQSQSLNIHTLNVEGTYKCFNNSSLIFSNLYVAPKSIFIRVLKETDAATGVSKYLIKDNLGLQYLDTIIDTKILTNLCFGNDLVVEQLPNLVMQKNTTIDGQGFKLKLAIPHDESAMPAFVGGAACDAPTCITETQDLTGNIFKRVLKATTLTVKNLVIESSSSSLIDTIEKKGAFNGSHLAFRGGRADFAIAKTSKGSCELDYVFVTGEESVGFLGSGKRAITNSYFLKQDGNVLIHHHRPKQIKNNLFSAKSYGFEDFSRHTTTLEDKFFPMLQFEKDVLGANPDNIILGEDIREIYFYDSQGFSYPLHGPKAFYQPKTSFGNVSVIRLNKNYVIFADQAGAELPFSAKVITKDGKEIYHVDVQNLLPKLNSSYTINMHGDNIKVIPKTMFETTEPLIYRDSADSYIANTSLYIRNIQDASIDSSRHKLGVFSARNSMLIGEAIELFDDDSITASTFTTNQLHLAVDIEMTHIGGNRFHLGKYLDEDDPCVFLNMQGDAIAIYSNHKSLTVNSNWIDCSSESLKLLASFDFDAQDVDIKFAFKEKISLFLNTKKIRFLNDKFVTRAGNRTHFGGYFGEPKETRYIDYLEIGYLEQNITGFPVENINIDGKEYDGLFAKICGFASKLIINTSDKRNYLYFTSIPDSVVINTKNGHDDIICKGKKEAIANLIGGNTVVKFPCEEMLRYVYRYSEIILPYKPTTNITFLLADRVTADDRLFMDLSAVKTINISRTGSDISDDPVIYKSQADNSATVGNLKVVSFRSVMMSDLIRTVIDDNVSAEKIFTEFYDLIGISGKKDNLELEFYTGMWWSKINVYADKTSKITANIGSAEKFKADSLYRKHGLFKARSELDLTLSESIEQVHIKDFGKVTLHGNDYYIESLHVQGLKKLDVSGLTGFTLGTDFAEGTAFAPETLSAAGIDEKETPFEANFINIDEVLFMGTDKSYDIRLGGVGAFDVTPGNGQNTITVYKSGNKKFSATGSYSKITSTSKQDKVVFAFRAQEGEDGLYEIEDKELDVETLRTFIPALGPTQYQFDEATLTSVMVDDMGKEYIIQHEGDLSHIISNATFVQLFNLSKPKIASERNLLKITSEKDSATEFNFARIADVFSISSKDPTEIDLGAYPKEHNFNIDLLDGAFLNVLSLPDSVVNVCSDGAREQKALVKYDERFTSSTVSEIYGEGAAAAGLKKQIVIDGKIVEYEPSIDADLAFKD